MSGTSRRTVLQAGAAAALVPALGTAAQPASAAGPGSTDQPDAVAQPGATGRAGDAANPQFTLALVPDTQYLFDLDRGDSAPLAATFEYLIDQRVAENLVFTAHLGDVVENAQPSEFAQADPVFGILDRARMPYSVLAGNHDIDSRTDDTRGETPYSRTFGPARFRRMRTYGGSTAHGYNSYHVFRGGGRQWLLLAMDWRPSDESFAWARGVIAAHPRLPVILTTHELVDAETDDPVARFSAHGNRVWEQPVEGNDQIFLTLNGHYCPAGPSGRMPPATTSTCTSPTTRTGTTAVPGWSGCTTSTWPGTRSTSRRSRPGSWRRTRPGDRRWPRARASSPTTGNRFSVPIDFAGRFAGLDPVPVRLARPASRMMIPGTVAYWRFDSTVGAEVRDHSGQGNHLAPVLLPGSPASSLTASAEHHPDQPEHGNWLPGASDRRGAGTCGPRTTHR